MKQKNAEIFIKYYEVLVFMGEKLGSIFFYLFHFHFLFLHGMVKMPFFIDLCLTHSHSEIH